MWRLPSCPADRVSSPALGATLPENTNKENKAGISWEAGIRVSINFWFTSPSFDYMTADNMTVFSPFNLFSNILQHHDTSIVNILTVCPMPSHKATLTCSSVAGVFSTTLRFSPVWHAITSTVNLFVLKQDNCKIITKQMAMPECYSCVYTPYIGYITPSVNLNLYPLGLHAGRRARKMQTFVWQLSFPRQPFHSRASFTGLFVKKV